MTDLILSPTRAPLACLVLAAALAGCAVPWGGSTLAAAPAAEAPPAVTLPTLLVYGDDGALAPYSLFLGTPANFSTLVPKNGQGALDAGSIKVQPVKVGERNGAKFTWTGGLGQFHLQSKNANDLADYIEANSALVFDAIVHRSPDDQVTMRVDCRYPCLGVVDMTAFYKAAPIDKKITVKVPLTCFEATGAKFTAVNTPLVMFTTKPFALSVANVTYVPGAAKDADAVKCAGA